MRPIGGAARWPLALVAAAGVAAPATLALLGMARPGPAIAAAAGLAGLAAWLWLRQEDTANQPAVAPPQPTAPPAGSAAPPFAAVLDQLDDPVLLIVGGSREEASARRFVFANAAARNLLRIQRPGGPLTTAIRAPEVLAAVDDALYRGAPGQALYQSGGVQDRVWRARAIPMTDIETGPELVDGRLVLLTLRDDTELWRSERTRADFLANASHELRTPLASLSGFIETLRGHARDDPEARDRFLAIMHIQAERMRRLIDDLMSLSRIELAEHIPPSSTVDLAVAVIDVLDALGPMAEEKCARFQREVPAAGLAVGVGDRDQILQVIQNLAENALKYTPRGGVVEVEVSAGLGASEAAAPLQGEAAHLSLLTPDHAAGERYLVLRVRDSGPGIARNHLPRLTERFYRVEGQKSGEHTGTGLGLAIVKHIVNRHRGGLAVESAPGQGSTFIAYFPMAPRTPEPEGAALTG